MPKLKRTRLLTSEEVAEIRGMVDDGIAYNAICEDTGITMHQLNRLARNQCYHDPGYTPKKRGNRPMSREEITSIKDMRDHGMTLTAIAKAINRSVSAISRVIGGSRHAGR